MLHNFIFLGIIKSFANFGIVTSSVVEKFKLSLLDYARSDSMNTRN